MALTLPDDLLPDAGNVLELTVKAKAAVVAAVTALDELRVHAESMLPSADDLATGRGAPPGLFKLVSLVLDAQKIAGWVSGRLNHIKIRQA